MEEETLQQELSWQKEKEHLEHELQTSKQEIDKTHELQLKCTISDLKTESCPPGTCPAVRRQPERGVPTEGGGHSNSREVPEPTWLCTAREGPEGSQLATRPRETRT
ncbi:hypothetical protein PRIEUP_LOCUS1170 [Pristimantis euphronides]